MDNQHRKISGYPELSQEEIDLMNEIKAVGHQLGAIHAKVQGFLIDTRSGISDEAGVRQAQSECSRWCAIAKTDFQTGLMALTRAVAQPTFF